MNPPPLSNLQFKYGPHDVGGSKPLHRVDAFAGPTQAHAGMMIWDPKQIRGIHVPSDLQRRGVATALWEEGHRLAEETPGIPKPKHSADRTAAGDAWARSVGGRLPRRSGD
jgi:hypothetical protein